MPSPWRPAATCGRPSTASSTICVAAGGSTRSSSSTWALRPPALPARPEGCEPGRWSSLRRRVPSASDPPARDSHHQVAAVDVDRRAGDVAGPLGGKKTDQFGHLGGGAQARHGEGPNVDGQLLGGGVLAGQLGVDQAWTDRVDGDAERAELLRGGAGEAEEAGLGGGVVGAAQGAHALAGGRREVDD